MSNSKTYLLGHKGINYSISESVLFHFRDYLFNFNDDDCHCNMFSESCSYCRHPGNPVNLKKYICDGNQSSINDGLPEEYMPPEEPIKPKRINGEIRRLFRLPTPEEEL